MTPPQRNTELLCCSMLQCVAACCSVLQCIAVCLFCGGVDDSSTKKLRIGLLQWCDAVCCSALWCVAVCRKCVSFAEEQMTPPQRNSALVCCSMLLCVAVCCSVSLWRRSKWILHKETLDWCVAVGGCSVLQCVAVCRSVSQVCRKCGFFAEE